MRHSFTSSVGQDAQVGGVATAGYFPSPGQLGSDQTPAG